jgi:hypothetical protein
MRERIIAPKLFAGIDVRHIGKDPSRLVIRESATTGKQDIHLVDHMLGNGLIAST